MNHSAPEDAPPGLSRIPRHVAVIMDGNGRWAKARNLPRRKGHEEGAEALKRTVEAAFELGVEYLTFYAFSMENWSRPKLEVAYLMELIGKALKEYSSEVSEKNIRVETIGRIADLPRDVQKKLRALIENTEKNTGGTVILALSYGSRAEIVDSVRSIVQEVSEGRVNPDKIDEDLVSSHLYTARFPDPDLLIRTSGEMRLSNFLLWQLSYAELFMTPVLWPDFSKEHFLQAIEDYSNRQRRFGTVVT